MALFSAVKNESFGSVFKPLDIVFIQNKKVENPVERMFNAFDYVFLLLLCHGDWIINVTFKLIPIKKGD